MSTRRAFHACLALMVLGQALVWWRAIAWYPRLPERFPMHFNMRGTPDSWANRGPAWFLLPAASLGLVGLFVAVAASIGWLARRTPMLVNMPNKEVFVRLSPAGRMRVVAPTGTFLLWTASMVTFLFAFIIEGTGRVAVKELDTLQPWPLLGFLGGVFAGLIAFVLVTSRLVDRVAREEGVERR